MREGLRRLRAHPEPLSSRSSRRRRLHHQWSPRTPQMRATTSCHETARGSPNMVRPSSPAARARDHRPPLQRRLVCSARGSRAPFSDKCLSCCKHPRPSGGARAGPLQARVPQPRPGRLGRGAARLRASGVRRPLRRDCAHRLRPVALPQGKRAARFSLRRPTAACDIGQNAAPRSPPRRASSAARSRQSSAGHPARRRSRKGRPGPAPLRSSARPSCSSGGARGDPGSNRLFPRSCACGCGGPRAGLVTRPDPPAAALPDSSHPSQGAGGGRP